MSNINENLIIKGYDYAKEVYAQLNVDVDEALKKADSIPVSMHSWQGDDLIGFDGSDKLTGGIAATGSYFGRARTIDELMADMDKAMTLIPGEVKVNLHACHAHLNGKKVDRNEYTISEFTSWVDWAKQKNIGLDFNPTFFSHPKMDGDFSLCSSDAGVRDFWIDHGKCCRKIAEEFGKRLGKTSVVNYWMPDGYKDIPADTFVLRELMANSLDEIFKEKLDKKYVREAVESKLFGFGLESYTVASHEFSYGYAVTRDKVYCLDAGHFHPTESIADKISSVLLFTENVLLHLSRGVRWDSDHVVTWSEELQSIMNVIIHNGFENRVFIGQDYFDASINRIACWAIAMRNTRKAILKAYLDPIAEIKKAEQNADYTKRLALLEETKSLPFAAVWDYYCLTKQKPVGKAWLDEVDSYEKNVLSKRV